MSVIITENELPIKQHGVGECYNCKNVRHVRKVLIYSPFGGANRGYYQLCFFCFGPVYRWHNSALKESRTYETPHRRENYIAELEAAEHPLQTDAKPANERIDVTRIKSLDHTHRPLPKALRR